MTPQFGLLAQLAGPTKPSLQEQTADEYQGIADHLRQAAFRVSPQQPGDSRQLEFYPPGETDSFDPTRAAIEVFNPKTRPIDVAGDLVSHYLARGKDPTITKAYRNFETSLTPKQQAMLQEQYQWAQKNEGEKRPFDEWYQMTGLPAYFRGYLFKQWPDSEHYYTPQQILDFNTLNQYLKNPPPPKPPLPAGLRRRETK
jgi:hypothetical protein